MLSLLPTLLFLNHLNGENALARSSQELLISDDEIYLRVSTVSRAFVLHVTDLGRSLASYRVS